MGDDGNVEGHDEALDAADIVFVSAVLVEGVRSTHLECQHDCLQGDLCVGYGVGCPSQALTSPVCVQSSLDQSESSPVQSFPLVTPPPQFVTP